MRILVVEDDPAFRDSLVRGLRQAGHAVDAAATVAESLAKLGLETYEAVVLDISLPDGSGLDLARTLRRTGSTVLILAATARDAIADRVAGLDAGADDYLVKPFAFEELLARLRALDRRQRSVRPAVIEVADLYLDPASRTARRGSHLLDLTATEFSLLEFLARHAGQVVGRAMISAHVWDENYDPVSNIIDVYIARLRKRVDLPDHTPMLHTVRGVGYVLRPGSADG